MSIKALSKQLINQIAAGEVVQRPSSVVKELIENSFDAGASKIQIDIEKGGIKLIRVSDNGHGIHKNDLKLALASYATSKISSINDLDKIQSLGFRGEALASISSISRLTLISRSFQDSQAWQIYSEGRNNLFQIKPAAHPYGTTLEVVNLFYNTPARRKFLCTEKTEFIHIDKIVRNLALSRFDVSIILNHNGNLIRQYKSNNNQILQNEKRLSFIYGNNFIEKSLRLNYEIKGLKLYGWIIDLCFLSGKNLPYQYDLKYCYVNKRMIQNKLINNAIRRAYQDYQKDKECDYPRYIIYIDIDPYEIDMNVHPTKKDVRFYQARLVHDFIYQSIFRTLEVQNKDKNVNKNTNITQIKSDILNIKNYFEYNNNKKKCSKNFDNQYEKINENSSYINNNKNYKCLIFNNVNHDDNIKNILMIVKKNYALLEHVKGLVLISLSFAAKLFNKFQLNEKKRIIKPLIIPIHIETSKNNQLVIYTNQYLFKSIGIDIKCIKKYIVLYTIPFFCEKQKISNIIHDLLNYISQKERNILQVINWLLNHVEIKIYNWNILNAMKLLKTIKQFHPQLFNYPPKGLLQIINIYDLINLLKKE